ncbi:response regulator [Pedobacter kyonggii]|uniref:Response regulator n=1 Tax=Pedobacter kyonggii TaxID=1926871 RepID=A0A4Q9H3M8_9SPHI|nr:response regulator [Pedobacter kyonggii]TBO36412.1 response regulator [Pedobacter kyonggii]
MVNVFVQDNDRDIMEVISFALMSEGFRVFAIDRLDNTTLEQLETFRPDIVLLDYHINGHTAIPMLKLIKENFPQLPVIAMSCNSDIERDAAEFGFDGYLKKPFDLKTIFSLIRKVPQKAKVGEPAFLQG